MSFWRDNDMDLLEEKLKLECLYHEDQSGNPFFWDRVKFKDGKYELPTPKMIKKDCIKLYLNSLGNE